MNCKNCGRETTGMKFCTHCGTAVEENSESIVAKSINNTLQNAKTDKSIRVMGWILALLPLIGLTTMLLPDSIFNAIRPGVIGLNIGLWYADKRMLKKQGYTGKWTWWGIIFIPVYLYFRCKKTNGKYIKLICNIVSIILVFVIAVIPLNFNQQDYNENYEWWLEYSSSFDKDTYGIMAADYSATFVSDKNEYIKLYAYENRDGSMQLNFNILITGTGEELQILGTDSYQAKYSIIDNKHCWTYKNINSLSDEVIITYIAEDRTLTVTSSAELFGLFENQYSHIITGIYKPI